jgi:hypothetical protein
MAEAASWWLKLQRAEQHLLEVKAALRDYGHRHPYAAVLTAPAVAQAQQSTDTRWVYHLCITEQPDPELVVIIGEILYDLRSALDHLAMALAPPSRQKHAHFPIAVEDPGRVDAGGSFLRKGEQARQRFERALRGMPQPAIELIKAMQPSALGADAETAPLALLNWLHHAEQQHRLVIVASGVADVQTTVRARGEILVQTAPGFCTDGAEIARFDWRNPIPLTQTDVAVQVRGITMVAMLAGDRASSGHYPVPEVLDIVLTDLWDNVIPPLEHFVRGYSVD